MGTNGVIEFNFGVAEEGLSQYKSLHAEMESTIEELTNQIKENPAEWTGDTEMVAKALLHDSQVKAEMMQGNIAAINNAIVQARDSFIANDRQNNQILINAKR